MEVDLMKKAKRTRKAEASPALIARIVKLRKEGTTWRELTSRWPSAYHVYWKEIGRRSGLTEEQARAKSPAAKAARAGWRNRAA